MNLKYVTGPITKADAGGLEAVISTPKVDSDGESVDPKGLTNREDWLANPLIYWAHEWAFDPSAEPIGKGTRLDVHADRIESAALYAPTPKAQNVRALVAGGFVRKTSIGFDPLEIADIKGVATHTKWALREWSVVPMPANTDATITGVKSALRWLADGIVEPHGETEDGVTVRFTAAQVEAFLKATLDEHLILTTDVDAQVTSAIERSGRRVLQLRRRRRILTLPS
jgi:HK97 family phage prohead protease